VRRAAGRPASRYGDAGVTPRFQNCLRESKGATAMMNKPDSEAEDRPFPEGPQQEPESGQDECRDCDPRHFANRGCRRRGVEDEAAYLAQEKPALEQAQTDYATTRKAYRDKRHSVALQVQDLRHQIRHMVDRVRCLIQQDRVVDCLDRAFASICEQLDECGPVGGCCVDDDDDCEFDVECPEDYDELVRRIADYTAHLTRDKACFATLVAEPAALQARVDSATQAVHDVAEALTKDPSTIDLKTWYANALVAQRALQLIWNGFPETKDFLDCLCRVYDCWINAVDAVAILTREKGVKDCHREARETHCQDLAAKTADAIVMEYERICCHGHRHNRDHHEHTHEHHEQERENKRWA
jgi:hypothetical protein